MPKLRKAGKNVVTSRNADTQFENITLLSAANAGTVYVAETFSETMTKNTRGATDGIATDAHADHPYNVVAESAGTACVSHDHRNVVRKITASGAVSIIGREPQL